MKYSTWLGLFSVIAVVLACYRPWVYIPAAQLEIAGMYASASQNFGKPGLINLICSIGAGILFLVPQVWAKRANIFFCGFNIAWAIRNYVLLSRCYMGDCPIKKVGLYVLLIASAIMLFMSFIPDVKIKDESKTAV
ncbi:MAG: hypothetical protein ABI813_01925 [Bacteroidota bacterium]